MSLLPRTMVGRTVLVLLAGLLVSHVVGFALYAGDRWTAVAAAAERRMADTVAVAFRELEETPAADRPDLARSLSRPLLRLTWSADAAVAAPESGWRARSVGRVLGERLDGLAPDSIRVAHRPAEAGDWEGRPGRWGRGDGRGRGMGPGRHWRHHEPAWRRGLVVAASLRLGDGSWLNVTAPSVPFRPPWASPFFASMIVTTIAVMLLSVWAVRRATAPLGLFARAAERLGLDVNAPPLAEEGPREVRRAARAFNDMQKRLRAFVKDRTQMLAAISHDLRTPITRLRLRAEFIEDEEQRARMLADLEQMEAMIAATLAFAGDEAAAEARKPFDLAVLLNDLCEDAAEAGQAVEYRGPARVTVSGRPIALRRAFANLIDNAVKYAGGGRVTVGETDPAVIVAVEDDGPGIPPDELERAFDPFYRVEPSRSRETGGVGLGLAVVRSIVRGHGGDVRLENRSEGGMRATVTLPRA